MTPRRGARRARRSKSEPIGRVRSGLHGMLDVIEKGDSRQLPSDQAAFNYDLAIEPPLPPDALLSLADLNSFHASCIDAKVTDAVGRGWYLEPEDKTEDGADDDEDKVERELRSWLKARCRKLTFGQLCQQAVRELEKVGWGVWEIARDGEEISDIWPLPAQTLRATKDRDVYVVSRNGKSVYFKRFGARPKDTLHAITGKWVKVEGDEVANEVLLFEHYSEKSTYYGVPRWISVIPAIAEQAAIRDYNLGFFHSGGTTDRSIHVTADQKDDAKEISESILAALQEAKGKGHTTVVSHGSGDSKVNVEHLSQTEGRRDGQFTKRRDDLVKETIVGHQVPPYRVGWAELGSLGGNAAKEMIGAYRDGVIEPLQEIIETKLHDTLFSVEAGGFDLPGWLFRFNDKDWEEEELAVTKAQAAVESGMATPAEGARMLGFTPPSEEDAPELYRYYYKGQPLGDGLTEASDVVREFSKALNAVVEVKKDETADELPVAA